MDGNLITILATIGSTLGVGGVIAVVARAIADWGAGKPQREQSAWEQRDREAKARRMLEEYAHDLRHELIELGLDPNDLPEWPEYTTRDK